MMLAPLLVLSCMAVSAPSSFEECFRRGDLTEAKRLASAQLNQEPGSLAARRVLAQVLVLENNLTEADRVLAAALKASPEDKLLTGLQAIIAYRQMDYPRAALLFAKSGNVGRSKQLASFGASVPYKKLGQSAKIKFVQVHPLPILELAVEGHRANFVLDTGAGETILDTDFARSLRIEPIAEATGTFAAGQKAGVGLGRAKSISFPGVTLENIPVQILSTKKFALIANGLPVHGVLGIGVLSQFCSTIDYANGVLKLEPTVAATPGAPGEPMLLAGDHFVLARGQVGDVQGLLFVDTGLAGAAYAGPTSVLKELGVKLGAGAIEGVGGGGKVSVTPFVLDRLALGKLVRSDVVGIAGAFPESLEYAHGCRIVGIVSHAFFSRGTLRLDFTNMRLGLAGP